MKILVTNDDGIDSEGLKILWESLKEHAELRIAAPAMQQSGKGVGITYDLPLKVFEVDSYGTTPSWKIEGTPADCVKLSLSVLLDFTPDLIVSGINHGSNAGRNVLYSGTVGAIIEGVLRGIPGVAFSYACVKTPTFPFIKKFIPQIVAYLVEHPLPKGSFLNVNFPPIPEDQIKGFKMACQGKGYWLESPEKEITSLGQSQYWMIGNRCFYEEPEDSDVTLLDQGYITAVPIHIDQLTDQIHLKEKKNLFESALNQCFFRNCDTHF